MPKKPTASPKGAVARQGLKGPKGSQPRRKRGRKPSTPKAPIAPANTEVDPAQSEPEPEPENSAVAQLLMEKAEEIRALSGFGLTDTEIAVVVGIKPQELYQFSDVIGPWLTEGRAKAKAQVRQSLFRQAVLGSAQHINMYEQLVNGWRPTQRQERTGADGGPVTTESTNVNIGVVMTDDEIMARFRTLRDRHLSVVDAESAQAASAAEGVVIEDARLAALEDGE